MTMVKSIKDVPNEILCSIFSYLNARELQSLARVCPHWKHVCSDPVVWKHSHFVTQGKSPDFQWASTLYFLKWAPHLYSITVSENHSLCEVDEIFNSVCEHSPSNLHEIDVLVDFASCRRFLLRSAQLLTNIQVVKINRLSDSNYLVATLEPYKRLKKIVFHKNIPDSYTLSSIFRCCPKVNELEMPTAKLSSSCLKVLTEHRVRLVGLKLCVQVLSEDDLKDLSGFTNLRTFHVAEHILTSARLALIGQLPLLTGLSFKEVFKSPVLTAMDLSKFFRTNTFLRLQEIKLEKSRLDDDGAAEIRRNCPELRHLEVNTYPKEPIKLTDNGLLHFLHCRKLQYMEVLFASSIMSDWIYRRRCFLQHHCPIDEDCNEGLAALLEMWSEVEVPIED